MEFNIICPIDGSIGVSLEDIETVVLRDSEHADITFACPHCGSEITVAAVVPSFLLSAMEALSDTDSMSAEGMIIRSEKMPEENVVEEPVVSVPESSDDDERFEAYCEYFRRQLCDITSVQDALNEMDSKA